MKTIAVLGGGIGGIVAASRLRSRLPREHRVVLVERDPTHVFAPSLLWLMIGERTGEAISRPLAALGKRGVELVHGTIQAIDATSRAVRVDGNEIRADYLVIALGADLAPQTIPGLAEGGHNFYSLQGAASLRDARLELQAGRVVVLVSAIPYKCPGAPNEAAMLLEADFRRRGLRDKVQVDLYTAEPGPMPVAGPVVSAALRRMIEARGIGYHPDCTTTSVDPVRRRISFANGETAAYDLLAYIPPHRAPQVVRDAGLCGETGWVPVDRRTLETKFPGVYAIGDVAGIMLTAIGRPLPKAGVFAHYEAEVVADNIVRAITGKGSPREFAGDGACFLEAGDGKAGYGAGNFFAEPAPQIKLRAPSRMMHWGKVAFEKYWLFRWF